MLDALLCQNLIVGMLPIASDGQGHGSEERAVSDVSDWTVKADLSLIFFTYLLIQWCQRSAEVFRC